MQAKALTNHCSTNIQKIHKTFLNSMVSKTIHDQGKTLFCWAFAISTMLRQSLKLFISHYGNSFITADLTDSGRINDALTKLKDNSFHRQLRNELIMIPIPKNFSTNYNEESRYYQADSVIWALQRVKNLTQIQISP